jgi:5'-3' exonuclease
MGIPSYFSYIVKTHHKIIKNLSSQNLNVDNLYLDCNSIIYDIINNMDDSTYDNPESNIIIKNVLYKIEEYISLIKPKNHVYIAFDGVAPVAKLEQQRQRRYKSAFQKKMSKIIFENKKQNSFNTSLITPGTIFMEELNESIKSYFNSPSKYNVCEIILSTSNVVGEGEHKIFEFIRENAIINNDKCNVIYGLDADLIMLSINHLPIVKYIYLFRETPHFIQSINSSLKPDCNYLMDIPELARIISLDMNNGCELTDDIQQNRIYDYIFLCFFLGNDFMPHFPSLNIRTGGINKLISAYKSTIGNTKCNLTNGKIIYWKNVRKLINYLVPLEESFIKDEFDQRNKKEHKYYSLNKPEDIFKKFEEIPRIDREVEKYINPNKPYWEERYYKSLFYIDGDNERLKQISINFLEGLEWTMKYYTIGCADWRWCYKYNYPPLLKDLIKHIPYFETEFIENKPVSSVSPLIQLCYVLPEQSLYLLPEHLRNKLILKYKHLYSSDCKFVWAFCNYFWECHAELPYIDINELEKITTNIE